MWLGFSPEARTALRGSHTAVTRVDVLHGGFPVRQLDVLDGAVSWSSTGAVRANLQATLTDPTGDLTTGNVGDVLTAFDCEIAVYRGVKYQVKTYGEMKTPNAGFGLQGFGNTGFGGQNVSTIFTTRDVVEYAPLGVFGLTNKRVADSPDGLTITLEGQDRAMRYQTPMKSSLGIAGATAVEDAILRLLARADPNVNLFAMRTGHTVGPLLFPPNIDVWEEAQKLAASVGARLFHDRVGQCVLLPAGPDRYPVFSYAEGDGLLLSLDRAEDSDSINNIVVARNSNGTFQTFAYDADPQSPTFAGGRYGYHVFAVENEHINSVAQSQQAAVAALIRQLGRVEVTTFEAVPDPARDVDDAGTLHRPRAGLTRRAVVIDTIDMPLTVDGRMRVGCRKSVLTQDGDVIPDEEAA